MSGGLVSFPAVDTLMVHFSVPSADPDQFTQTDDISTIAPLAVGYGLAVGSVTPAANTNHYFLPGNFALAAVFMRAESITTSALEVRVWKNGDDDAPQTNGAACIANFTDAGVASDAILFPVAAVETHLYYSNDTLFDPLSTPVAGANVFNDTNKLFGPGDRVGVTTTGNGGTSTPLGLSLVLTFCRIGGTDVLV